MNSREGVSPRTSRIRDSLAVALLLLLTVAFFSRLVLGNLVMAGLDVFNYFYPYKAYAAETLRTGSLPLWNPYLFMGVPFLANIQSAVLYPLNLPFLWLSAPKMVSWSILVHVFMAGAFTYGFARQSLALGPWGSLVSATTLAFGGFLGAQAEHVNQVNVLVWLPLLLWLLYLAYTTRSWVYVVLTGVITGIQFLGGHTQASYINLVALGCYSLYLPFRGPASRSFPTWRSPEVRLDLARSLGVFMLVALLGGALAAIQLVPTYELSRLSIRSAGLSYRQAVSFSLHPGSLHRSLFPALGDSPFSEYIAYIGILPLLLAILAMGRRRERHQASFFLALSALGLFLSLGVYNPLYYLLYRLLPGFGLFRVPARWLYLYIVGMAVLAGLGFEELVVVSDRLRRPTGRRVLLGSGLVALLLALVWHDPPSPIIVVYWLGCASLGGILLWLGLRRQRGPVYVALVASLVVGELFLASLHQPYNRLTAPEAFSSLRTSVAHLLTDDGVYRVLGFSDGTFDPGDLREIEQNLSQQLSEEAVYDYLVATKQKEMLTPNLPLLYRIQSVDGYDGGVLPLARYVAWQQLLLPEALISVDGRLQGRIAEIPTAQVLNMCNVKYIMTDKVYDTWVDGAYYDLGHRAILGGDGPADLTVDDLSSFEATALGVVSYLIGAEDTPQGFIVAEITVEDDLGHSSSFQLRAGEDTAEGEYSKAAPRHQEARVVGQWRGNEGGNDYYTLLEWEHAARPLRIKIEFLGDRGQLRLRGMTLLDQRTGTHRALVVSSEGNFELVHSGDVKIYKNLDVLPRAFAVHEVLFTQSDAEALSVLQEEEFDPGAQVLLIGAPTSTASQGEHCDDQVRLVSYTAESVSVEAKMGCSGHLVLTDAYYPGWVALVDGEPQEILRADHYFRAVFLPQGQHVVEFRYRPSSLRAGLVVSMTAMLSSAIGFVWQPLRRRPPPPGRESRGSQRPRS